MLNQHNWRPSIHFHNDNRSLRHRVIVVRGKPAVILRFLVKIDTRRRVQESKVTQPYFVHEIHVSLPGYMCCPENGRKIRTKCMAIDTVISKIKSSSSISRRLLHNHINKAGIQGYMSRWPTLWRGGPGALQGNLERSSWSSVRERETHPTTVRYTGSTWNTGESFIWDRVCPPEQI